MAKGVPGKQKLTADVSHTVPIQLWVFYKQTSVKAKLLYYPGDFLFKADSNKTVSIALL